MPKPATVPRYCNTLRVYGVLGVFILTSFHLSAQSSFRLPPDWQKLTGANARLAVLRSMIADSVEAGRRDRIPAMAWYGLSIAAVTPTDTLAHMFYQFLGDHYDGRNSDSAAWYFQRSLRTNTAHQNQLNRLYKQQSLLYIYTGMYLKDSILHYIRELEKSISVLPDSDRSKLNVSNTLATSYQAISRYDDAIRYFRFVITQATKLRDSALLLNSFVNTGVAYNQTGNDRQAVYYTLQAIPFIGNDEYAALITYANVSDYYSSLGILDSSRLFLARAEKLAAKSNDEQAINAIALRKANIYVAENKPGLAEPILKQTLAFFSTHEPGQDLVNNLLIYASLDTLQGNLPAAEAHLLDLYKITTRLDQAAYKSTNLRFLSIVNERMGDYRDAYHYQLQYTAIDDSIRSEKVLENFSALQTEYETYKKEERINLLQKEGLIKDLRIREANRKRTIYIGGAAVLLGLLLLLLYIRHLRGKTILERTKASLEMKALRSQMNPHFIFNSLNSIQKYIWENKREDASEYLTRFARLIRLVLENSRREAIPLSDELDALRLYIEMEHRRNNQGFDYRISISEQVDPEQTCIAPLLLQPYVENAIWHGLSAKEGRGQLSVNISRENGSIRCVVEDDGIGRAAASAARKGSIHQSLAMNISDERIRWLRQGQKKNATVSIEDLFIAGEPAGTRVTILLPVVMNKVNPPLIEEHD
ncbi:MAG: tetratricopeptide repeat protein [Chitinophagaceae bacterium]|nr:MAG: tetratricopeptide repeat protein [Chitinophagaceae bacterium]